MSVFPGAGPIGFADGQRTVNWDAAPIVSESNVQRTGSYTWGPFSVARYAAIGGGWSITQNLATLELSWSTDALGAHVIGQRFMQIDPGSMFYAPSAIFRNLGPYLSVTVTGAGGSGQWTSNLQLYPTNRVLPVEFTPTQLVQCGESNLSAPAGGVTVGANDYWSGPAVLWLGATAFPCSWQLQSQSVGGSWTIVSSGTVGLNVNAVVPILIPAGAWRLQCFGVGGTSQIYCAIALAASGSN
jgi:hypothetical protein